MSQTLTPVVTLTTDFGTTDHYVGCMKGVILSLAPAVRIVDITHEIEPRNLIQGAFVLRHSWAWFPPGTIHVVVVDPGVGTDRRIIVGRYDGQYVVAPDNGLITFLHRDLTTEAMHVVENRRYFLPRVSNTFHGRDIMAPVAAHLANGVKPHLLGRPTERVEVIPLEHRARSVGNSLHGRVLYTDHFGNLITNIRAEQLSDLGKSMDRVEVTVGERSVGSIRTAFADGEREKLLAIIGSTGMVEIVVNQGSAADLLGAADEITVVAH